MKTHPPYYIKALLDVHTLPRPEVSDCVLKELLDDDLIERNSFGAWLTTPRGQAYAKLLGEVPLPEQIWIDPRQKP